MENKYFVPNIEDITVGYECEIFQDEVWKPFKFNVEEIIPVFARINSKTIISDKIRVPYLTKEQIIAEGWKQRPSEENLFYKGEGRDYDLYIINDNKIRIINNEIEDSIYYGECKDINTFRKIIKLLRI